MIKYPLRNIYNINMYVCDKKIANYNFSVQNNLATINNIHVHKKNNGYGSFILYKIEDYVKNIYNVNTINVCAWQEYGTGNDNDNVLNFYKKNGYHQLNKTPQIYDDSVFLYDLYTFQKEINHSN